MLQDTLYYRVGLDTWRSYIEIRYVRLGKTQVSDTWAVTQLREQTISCSDGRHLRFAVLGWRGTTPQSAGIEIRASSDLSHNHSSDPLVWRLDGRIFGFINVCWNLLKAKRHCKWSNIQYLQINLLSIRKKRVFNNTVISILFFYLTRRN